MQLLDTPRTGKLGPYVFYTDATGERQFCRTLAIPSNPQTAAQTKARGAFSYASGLWTRRLTDPQREQWIAAALNVPCDPWLGRYSHLSGQQLEVKINSTLQCIGAQPVLEPPQVVAFSPNPVTGFSIVNDPEAGTRLRLSVGTVTEDIMVFGQPPCSAGRMKPRRAYYLGLAGPVTNGQVDITNLYTAKFGSPAPGQKVFIVTCQTKDGWKAQDHVFSAIVPPNPAGVRPSSGAARLKPKAAQSTSSAMESSVKAAPEDGRTPEVAQSQSLAPAAAPVAASPAVAPTQSPSSVSPAVYKGSTPDARRVQWGLKPVHAVSILGTPLVHGLRMAMNRLGMLGMVAPGT